MLKFIAWLPVGILFMVGIIAPVGFLIWIPAAVLAGLLLVTGMGSTRAAFSFVGGIALTLIGLGVVHTKYIFMIFVGGVVLTAAIVGYTAFGPRTSHADPPETFD